MNKAICCDGCFELIGMRNVYAARLWLDLCNLKVKNGIFGVKTSDLPEIRMLEVLGFITTTDSEEHIMIRVNGDKNDQEGPFFCCGNCN